VRSGQFEDTLTPAMRVLAEERTEKFPETKPNQTKMKNA